MAPPSPNTSCCPSLPPTFPTPSSWLHPAPSYLPGPVSQCILSPDSTPGLPNVYSARFVVRTTCCKKFNRLVTTSTSREKAAPELGSSLSKPSHYSP